MSTKIKMGLVLSGGGAIGAYHVGVIKALSECDNIKIDAVSGASIGALNAGLIASSSNLTEGYKKLKLLWDELANNDPIQLSYTKLLLSLGLTASDVMVFFDKTRTASTVAKHFLTSFNQLDGSQKGILKSEPIENKIDKFLDMDALENGIPLYISLYPSKGWMIDITQIALAVFNIKDTQKSVFKHVQNLPKQERKRLLIASAALPILFDSVVYEGQIFTDGGQGGWDKNQGNTPIEPLIDAGCTHAIVTHLANNSNWNRHDFPNIDILEIRPKRSLSRGKMFNLLDFSAKSLESWIEQGYEDTMQTIAPIIYQSRIQDDLKESSAQLQESPEEIQSKKLIDLSIESLIENRKSRVQITPCSKVKASTLKELLDK